METFNDSFVAACSIMEIKKTCTMVHAYSPITQDVERQKNYGFRDTFGFLLDLSPKVVGAKGEHRQVWLKLKCFSCSKMFKFLREKLRLIT